MSREKIEDGVIVEIEGCKQVIIYPPKDFISKDAITVDECVAKEIEDLWSKGIHTRGCCCGHGKRCGFIQIDNEDIKKMKDMEYLQYLYNDDLKRTDAFVPKSKCKNSMSRFEFKIKEETK